MLTIDCGALRNRSQFREASGTDGYDNVYIPLVVDVQKRLTNVLRTMEPDMLFVIIIQIKLLVLL